MYTFAEATRRNPLLYLYYINDTAFPAISRSFYTFICFHKQTCVYRLNVRMCFVSIKKLPSRRPHRYYNSLINDHSQDNGMQQVAGIAFYHRETFFVINFFMCRYRGRERERERALFQCKCSGISSLTSCVCESSSYFKAAGKIEAKVLATSTKFSRF